MRPISYVRARDLDDAVQLLAGTPGARPLAGGTNLVDLLRAGIETPAHLVDVGHLPLTRIEEQPGFLRIGALARMSDVAADPLVRATLPVVAEALVGGASPQLRNMATIGGNLLQRTRCPYFMGAGFACNKRQPGAGCDAMQGLNRGHAILGTSEHCIATHPSDLAVALVALEAVVVLRGRGGERRLALEDFFLEPGSTPWREHRLQPGELIVGVEVPRDPVARHSHYRTVRDRASFAFALASAAVALRVEDGVVRQARIALGGVATRPWRARAAEARLVGHAPQPRHFAEAADLAVADAHPVEHNAYKVELARRVVVAALRRLTDA